jgi:hypothetical protein
MALQEPSTQTIHYMDNKVALRAHTESNSQWESTYIATPPPDF